MHLRSQYTIKYKTFECFFKVRDSWILLPTSIAIVNHDTFDEPHPVNLYAFLLNGPLTRYVKFRVPHAPGMPGTFSPTPRFRDPDMHHGTCVTHVPWCMPGSLTSDFLWSRWRGKRSRHSRRMHNPQFYVSGKRPMGKYLQSTCIRVTCLHSDGTWVAWRQKITGNSTSCSADFSGY